MVISKLKKLVALCAATVSIAAIINLLIKGKPERGCSCESSMCRCDCDDEDIDIYLPESPARTTTKAHKPGSRRPVIACAGDCGEALDDPSDVFERIIEKSPSNESIAKVVMSQINLQNAVNPDEALDVRDIRFVASGNKNTMLVDYYCDDCNGPAYIDGVSRLWNDIFPAENFWNADFEKVKIQVKEGQSGKALETISCELASVREYLMKEASFEEFQASWGRRKAKNALPETAEKTEKTTKTTRLKRA